MQLHKVLESARHIVVEGPIGVGKTSLALRLAAHLEAKTLLEEPALNPFLERFYQDQARYALPTQLFFLFQRIEQLRSADADHAAQAAPPRVVYDYLLEKDKIFAELTLTDEEYALYLKVHEQTVFQRPAPDLVIYLQAAPEILIERVKKRGNESERKITDTYLTHLADRYSRFFYNYTAAPLMVVNSENLNFVDHDDDFRLLLARIESMRGQHGYFNRGE